MNNLEMIREIERRIGGEFDNVKAQLEVEAYFQIGYLVQYIVTMHKAYGKVRLSDIDRKMTAKAFTRDINIKKLGRDAPLVFFPRERLYEAFFHISDVDIITSSYFLTVRHELGHLVHNKNLRAEFGDDWIKELHQIKVLQDSIKDTWDMEALKSDGIQFAMKYNQLPLEKIANELGGVSLDELLKDPLLLF